jgi:hypothetical protein
LRKIERMAAERGVTLVVDASESLPVLRGDEKRLVQVIEFLLENAVKFSPAEGKVELSAVEHEGMLRITVRDDGDGIPAKDCEQIFEKSFALSEKHAENWGPSAALLGLPLYVRDRRISRRRSGRRRRGARCAHVRFSRLSSRLRPEALKAAALRVLLVMQVEPRRRGAPLRLNVTRGFAALSGSRRWCRS